MYVYSIHKDFVKNYYLLYLNKTRNSQVILFSHGNSTDIGGSFESLVDMAYNLKVLFYSNYFSFFFQRLMFLSMNIKDMDKQKENQLIMESLSIF